MDTSRAFPFFYLKKMYVFFRKHVRVFDNSSPLSTFYPGLDIIIIISDIFFYQNVDRHIVD